PPAYRRWQARWRALARRAPRGLARRAFARRGSAPIASCRSGWARGPRRRSPSPFAQLRPPRGDRPASSPRGPAGSRSVPSSSGSLLDLHRIVVSRASNTRACLDDHWPFPLADEEVGQVAERLLDALATEAVVGCGSGLDRGHEAGGAELGHVVAHGRLADLELLRELGAVQVAVGQELQDPEPGCVAERPVQPEDRR